MHYLRIAPIEGFMHELSYPERLDDQMVFLDNNVLDGNTIFWSELLRTENIKKVIKRLKQQPKKNLSPQYIAILENTGLFLDNVEHAIKSICDSGNRIDEFFSCLETLCILCKLYTDYVFYPHKLLLQSGFALKEYSFDIIYDECLDYTKNPYLFFIEKYIIPVIKQQNPDILFLEGKISFYNIAISKIIKRHFPHIHICVTRHSSEYYSLNKVTKYLLKNDKLFSVIDSLILEYFAETEEALINTLTAQKDISKHVKNILCRDINNHIIATSLANVYNNDKMEIWKRSDNQYDNLKISPIQTADIRLEPYVKCHWNKCSFCGINKKYSYVDNKFDSIKWKYTLHQIKQFAENGIRFIWFIDEAILPQKMKEIAKYIINKNIHVFWQARCRISKELLDYQLIQQLKESGLKELRMGLESASLAVLEDMNKFDKDFSLELVEKIVCSYTNNGISLHFPMIIGFPTETRIDRQRTYEFLSYLKNKYDLFTFNINIFNLDVASEVFKKWDQFSISQISFPCDSSAFLGNWIDFMSFADQTDLIREQEQFMREKLYPWMPKNSLLKPNIFYRLSETIRNTLIWKALGISQKECMFYGTMKLQKNSNMTISFDRKNNTYLVYNWSNHHYMRGNQLLINVLNEYHESLSIMQGIDNLIKNANNKYTEDDLIILLKKLIAYGYLVETVSKCEDHDCVSTLYNHLYDTENYPYRVEPDIMLHIWKEYIPVGIVLDLGIGSGKDIDYLLSLGNKVEGVDLSKTAINKLEQRYKNEHCSFVCEDIRDFSIAPETYSLIICSMTLSHLTKIEMSNLSKQIVRGLTPGGCVYICDLSEKDPMIKMETSHRCAIKPDDIYDWFDSLETIVIMDSYQKESRRIDYHGYFGIIKYLGKK